MFVNNDANKEINSDIQSFLYKAAKTYTEMDYYNKLNEFQNDPNQSISSQSSLLIAAPPTLSGLLANSSTKGYIIDELCIPIGGVANFNSSESNNIMPMGEVGSALMRMAPFDTVYSINIQRLFTNHSNLKYVMYHWVRKVIQEKGNGKVELLRPPGANGSTYYSGLESEMFSIPFGVIAAHCDASGNLVGADFFEMCTMSQYGRGIQSNSVVIMDNVSFYSCAVVPVDLSPLNVGNAHAYSINPTT
jgi:hypothetical protein